MKRWPSKSLDAVAEFRLGKMLDQRKNRGELLPYLANVNVRWGSFDLDDLKAMRFEQHELDKFGLKYGDIVMCEGGEPGRCAIWKNQFPSIMIQKALHRIRPRDCVVPEFLYYSLRHKGQTGHFAPFFTGATIKHLPREKLALVEIKLPALPVQERIAGVLAAYDDLIVNNTRRIKLLEDAARLLYEEWFVRLRFPGHEHTTIRDGIPEGWDRHRLKDVGSLLYGKALKKDDRVEGEYLVYGSSGVIGSHETALVKGPGIIVGRKGNVGSVHLSLRDFWPIDTVYYVDPDRFSYFLLHNLQYQNFINGDAAVPGLNRTFANSLPVVVPNKLLGEEFERQAIVLYAQIVNLQELNVKLIAAQELLLPRLMSGEVAV